MVSIPEAQGLLPDLPIGAGVAADGRKLCQAATWSRSRGAAFPEPQSRKQEEEILGILLLLRGAAWLADTSSQANGSGKRAKLGLGVVLSVVWRSSGLFSELGRGSGHFLKEPGFS